MLGQEEMMEPLVPHLKRPFSRIQDNFMSTCATEYTKNNLRDDHSWKPAKAIDQSTGE